MRKNLALIGAIALGFVPVLGGAFAAAPPPEGGTIAIQPMPVDGQQDPAMPAFVAAAADALTARGFTIFADPDHAASVVELVLNRAVVGTGVTKARGNGGPSILGAGVSVPLSTGNSRLVGLQRTRFEMRIRRRGAPDVVWDGAAVTVRESGTAEGSPATVATTLSRAILESYPAVPKEVVGVP